MDVSSKTLEHLRYDHRDALDKSGPKIARQKSIYDNLTSAQKSPYISHHTDDMVYNGIKKCCEINSKGYPTDRNSSHISFLRPFSENEFGSEIPGNFNLLLKRIKNESIDWDVSFNIRATPTHLQDPIWLFWLCDVLSTFLSILKKANIYSAIYVSQFSYTRNINVFKAFLECQSSNHSIMSLTPSRSPRPDGEVSFDDLVDPAEVEGLVTRIEKPSA
ncbi:hypothetical protein Vadar_017857 [Vaccinium darrowii]|uniref:Uncharacterized protein n=1 Tax=Vaccinium darrowii TaxID=229202 RepID=A0ACB7Y7R0_9ERIC|nr:hypothetical protein Vadar_017857 [Vaccinium darrowii]